MPRPEPIRVGDKFADGGGVVWEVIRALPGGHLDVMDRKRCMFWMTYTRDVRANWTRIPKSALLYPRG